jgi:type I restriction enzyme M protein
MLTVVALWPCYQFEDDKRLAGDLPNASGLKDPNWFATEQIRYTAARARRSPPHDHGPCLNKPFATSTTCSGKKPDARPNWNIEQASWLLFLKYLDSLEQDKADEAALEGKRYRYILEKPYRWQDWAAPKDRHGRVDHNLTMTGDDLRDFVDDELFPYLQGFKQRATDSRTIEYKVGEIFSEIRNKIHSGYNLREIIDQIDALKFRSQAEKHELSSLYEDKIKRMGNAGRNGGEYYTPRPLIRAMIKVVEPQIGETIADDACGSAGFLCEAFDYLRASKKLTTRDLKTLQDKTFSGQEKKSLAYVIDTMNMILHGVEAPNILHINSLSQNLFDLTEKDQVDIVLANPPFGGKERKEVQQNFPIRTGETAYLFLQRFIRRLKPGGRGAVVIKNTFLSNTDNASVGLRKHLLESCNLHTVLDCPSGTFQGAPASKSVRCVYYQWHVSEPWSRTVTETYTDSIAPTLIAIAERYPELSSQTSFVNLQTNLIDTEHRIALARSYFNDIATFYNTRQERIPDRFVVTLAALHPQPLLTAMEFEREPVNVSLAP